MISCLRAIKKITNYEKQERPVNEMDTEKQESVQNLREVLLRLPVNQGITMIYDMRSKLAQQENLQNYEINLNLLKGDMDVKFQMDQINEEKVSLLELHLINSTIHRDGFFLWHNDPKIYRKYKKESIRIELGKNYLLFNDALKRFLDPKGVFVVDTPLEYNITNPRTSFQDMISLSFQKLLDTNVGNQLQTLGENIN